MKTQLTAWLLACGITATLLVPASAATINWGDLSDPDGDVVFEDVGEENTAATTLFVPDGESPEALGNTLVLDPSLFIAEASGGASEIVDSELSFTVTAKDGVVLESISINESGAATLAGGLIGGMAGAGVHAVVAVTGAIVDGAFVDLNGVFAPFVATNNGSFLLPGDQGTTAWSGSSVYDTSVLGGEVTSVSFVIDNVLQAEADSLASARIDKKDFSVTVETDDLPPVVPEPTTLGLMVLSFATTAVWRRRG